MISETFHRDGLVRIPLLTPKECHVLRTLCDALTERFGVAATDCPRRNVAAMLHHTCVEWGGLQLDHVQAFLHHPNRMEKVLFQVETRIRKWFGNTYCIQPQLSFFRQCRLDVPRSIVDWHCDAEAASTLKTGTDVITAWVPLDPVGVKLPSLELIVGSHNIMSTCPPNNNNTDPYHRTDAWVSDISGDHVIPIIDSPGDAIVFSHFTLHRTQQLKADAPRRSCELRFLA